MKSVFDRFYLDQINEYKPSKDDNINHNKLRMYSTVKGCFKKEPYFDLVHSRNQRSWLTRLRCSAHNLEIELGRWNNTPLVDRACKICETGEIGDEFHFAMVCPVFSVKRACFVGKMDSVLPGFKLLTNQDKFRTMLCPTVSAACKVTNQFFRIMFLAREKLSEGHDIADLTYPTLPVPNYADYTFSELSDVDEWDSYCSDTNNESL